MKKIGIFVVWLLSFCSIGYCAIQFDGIDDQAYRDEAVVSSVPVTFYCVFKILDPDPQTENQQIFSLTDSSSNSHYFEFGSGSDGDTWVYQVRSGGSTYNAFNYAVAEGGTADDEWHSTLCISSANNNHDLYIDGSIVDTSAKTASPTGLDKTALGLLARSSPGFGNVEIRKFAVWNKALDSNEIHELLYTSSSPADVAESNLVLYLPLDDGEDGQSADGETISDNSGNAFDFVGSDGPNNSGLMWVIEIIPDGDSIIEVLTLIGEGFQTEIALLSFFSGLVLAVFVHLKGIF